MILDFLSGYCVHNTGDNHPGIIHELQRELARRGPVMLQSNVPDLAGDLARRLCCLAGGKLRKVFFACSGSEGVESAIKFSRAATGKAALLYADGAFHGLTCGALSLMGDDFWRAQFGPMLADTCDIPFNDLAALERQRATKRFAAFFVEPIQSEAGIRLPGQDYLTEAQRLCARCGALFVFDEVQTGMYRTGVFLPPITMAWNPISRFWRKLSAEGSSRAAPCSCRTASMQRSTIRSNARLSTHPPSAKTRCPCGRAWPL